MVRSTHFITPILFVLALVLVTAPAANVLAHGGHKHDKNAPQITLPDVLAKVGDTDIKKEAIWNHLAETVALFNGRGSPLSPDQQKTTAKKLLEKEISKTLLLQKGRELGIPASAETGGKLNGVLNQILKREVEPRIKISDDDIRNYYEKNPHRFQNDEMVRASVILIKVKDTDSEARRERAREKIESILDQVKGGADFGQLAKKFSQDSLRSRGGDLGFLEKKRMLPAFSQRAFKLKPGEVSDVFKTPYGYHILKVTERKPAKTTSLAEAKDKIEAYLKKKRLKQAAKSYIEELKKKADIQIYF